MFCHPAGSPLALRSRRPRDPYRDVSVWGPRGEPVLCVHTLRVAASPNAELSAGWWQDEARPEGIPSPALCPVSSPAPRSPPPRLPSGTGVRRPQPPRGSRAGNGGAGPRLSHASSVLGSQESRFPRTRHGAVQVQMRPPASQPRILEDARPSPSPEGGHVREAHRGQVPYAVPLPSPARSPSLRLRRAQLGPGAQTWPTGFAVFTLILEEGQARVFYS